MTAGYPSYYMINCAHPTHFEQVLAEGGAWLERIRGLRANASRKSHAELNASSELDMGDPVELGAQYAALSKQLKQLNIMGGCHLRVAFFWQDTFARGKTTTARR